MRFRGALLRELICTLIFSTILATLSNCAFALDDGITVILNGERMVFTDAQPYIKDSRTLVPFRKIFEAFGMQVSWDGNKRQVLGKGNDTEILLTIDDTTAYVNNAKKILDVPAQITNSRTFVPLRFVSESVGADVQWNGGTNTVTINYGNNNNVVEVSKPGEDGMYKLGQIGKSDDVKFSINSVSFDTVHKTVTIDGTISNPDKGTALYIFDSANRSIYIEPTILESKDGIYSFKGETALLYDNFKIGRIVIGYRDSNKIFRTIAIYSSK